MQDTTEAIRGCIVAPRLGPVRSPVRTATIQAVQPPENGDVWLGLSHAALPVAEAMTWAVLPSCGAVVTFAGTVRDHAIDGEGSVRDGVRWLDYEAYEAQVEPVLAEIDVETRRRWPSVGRVALLHRIGRIDLGEASVAVVVSAAHRPEAFEAARYAIDAIKSTVPIWKRESWEGGSDWGTGASHVVSPVDVGSPVTR